MEVAAGELVSADLVASVCNVVVVVVYLPLTGV
jgi:hypothetical protein